MTSKTLKTITLQRLTLENFKGIHSLVLDFGGRSAAIYGDNATGKTSIFDAWTWLLTGKDSHGQATFDIKPLDRDGNVLDRSARSVVEGVLCVDDQEITLRREYYEKWTEKRGSYEASYDGNSTDFYINDVPKGKRQYDAQVAELVPEKLLRLLSDAACFPQMKWQDRRAILFELANIGDDREMMAQEERFAPLLDATGGIGLEDYQKQIKIQRQKWNKERDGIPGRLSEMKQAETELADLPFDSIRKSAAELETEQSRLLDDLSVSQGDELAKLENDEKRLAVELSRLELDNDRFRAGQDTGSIGQAERLQSELTSLKLAYSYDSDRYHTAKRDLERYEARVAECRDRWREIRQRPYPGNAICPACGQPLPPEKQVEARQVWDAEQARQLKNTSDDGGRYKALSEKAAKTVEDLRESMIAWENKIARVKDELAGLESAPQAAITDMDGYSARKAELTQQLELAQARLAAARQDAAGRDWALRQKKAAIDGELQALRAQLAKEDILRYTRSRQDELNQKARDLSAQLAQTDRMLDLCDQFTRYKVDCITDGINRQFRLARFRLFTVQVNGGINPCCDILCGGVPYDSGLNSGAQINVGLDSIRTLSEYYGYRLPVFVDNAESVTRLDVPDTQVIRLIVSADDQKVRVAQ